MAGRATRPVLSTNLRKPSLTAGRANSSQKYIDFAPQLVARNRLDELFRRRGRFAIEFRQLRRRRTRDSQRISFAQPSGSPARPPALSSASILRPVSSNIANHRVARSRFSRGIPPKPGISPSRSSGKQNLAIFVRDDQIANQRQLESAAKRDPLHRRDRSSAATRRSHSSPVNPLQEVPQPRHRVRSSAS